MKSLLERIKLSLDILNKTMMQRTRVDNADFFSTEKNIKKHKDLSCYFKLPMYFFETNNISLAKESLDFIYNKFLMDNGDFKTTYNLKSEKPEYIEYWSYFNGWILRAANLLKLQIPDDALRYFRTMYIGQGKFMTRPVLKGEELITDVLTVAHHGLFYLESGDSKHAHEAASFLYLAFDSQKHLENKFLLRFNKNEQAIENYSAEQQMFFSIEKNKGKNQLYFMLAYPCAFLMLFYKKTGEKRALEFAKLYMDFIINSDENMHSSRFSHKTAWAASILYEVTNDQQYLNLVQKIVDFFISIQSENGLWFEDEGESVCFDQSAEIGCWFSQIMQNILNNQLKKENKFLTI